jgi:hypothetical protein
VGYFGNAYHGFAVNFPPSLKNGQNHDIHVKYGGSGIEVSNSPSSIACTLQPLSFYTTQPCRLVDTRGPAGPLGGPALVGQASRAFPLGGQCGLPTTARALAVNITVTGSSAQGSLVLYRSDLPTHPLATNIAYSANQTRASNTVLTLDPNGNASVWVSQPGGTAVHLILDVNGYFQ